MERLHNILGRSAPRRPSLIEQRAAAARNQQGSEDHSGYPMSQAAHRSSSEPVTRPLPHTPSEPYARPPMPPSSYTRSVQAGPPPSMNKTGPMPRRARNSLYTPPPVQSSGSQYQLSQTFLGDIDADYYEADAYTSTPIPQSDANDTWEEEGGMCYGDWEGEEEEELFDPYNHSADLMTMSSSYQSTTRSYPNSPITGTDLQRSIPETDFRSPLNRTLRRPGLTTPPPSQQIREQQTYQRVTQPLSPPPFEERVSERPQEIIRRQAERTRPPEAPKAAQVLPEVENFPTVSVGVCSACRGAGYLRANVSFGHPNFGKPIPCECKERERADKRRQELRLISNMDSFIDKTFNSFNIRVPGVKEAYDAALDYARDPFGWLVMIGRNGCGKTHLAAAIANQCLARNSLVLFMTVPDLLDHLRATFAPNSETVYDHLFSNMREAELLVLDDLGSEQSSSWASEKLFQLLNYRYNSGFPTVITTNNMRLQAVDERIRSRLKDHSLVTEITMERVQDYRPMNPRRDR